MAQGHGKLSKAKATKGGKKNKQQPKKGRRSIAPKRKHAINANDGIHTTKAINRKNEASIAAKAVASGTQFFLTDISKSGKDKLSRKITERNKKQGSANHLQKQLDKLQK